MGCKQESKHSRQTIGLVCTAFDNTDLSTSPLSFNVPCQPDGSDLSTIYKETEAQRVWLLYLKYCYWDPLGKKIKPGSDDDACDVIA